MGRKNVAGGGAIILIWIVLYFVLGRTHPPSTSSTTTPATPTGAPGASMPVEADPGAPGQTPTRQFGRSSAKPRTKNAIRVATYNLENLYDDHDDPTLAARFEDDPGTKPDAHCQAVADTIRALDADVIAVEEIESEEALKWFVGKYLASAGFPYAASIDAGDGRGIEQGVISRFPIRSMKNWPGMTLEGAQPDTIDGKPNPDAGKPIRMHRSPVRVEIATPWMTFDGSQLGHPQEFVFTLFIVHQKASKGFEFWRSAEAKATIGFVREWEGESPLRNIMILGDFNATPSDDSYKLFLESGLIDVFTQTTGDMDLWVTHQSARIIDHMLVNKAMASRIVSESRFVLGTPHKPRRSDWDKTPFPPGYASDHFPVVVDVRITEK